MRISVQQLKFFALSFFCVSFLTAGCSGDAGGNIHTAAIAGDLAKVKRLVAGGVDINKRGKKKVTPLHLAASQGNKRHIALAKWLLANGADMSARDYEGKTPLEVANARGNTEIADVIRGGRTGGGGRQLIDGGVGVSEVLDF
ncbi:MAG: ankyrin repeat domain-containing protein [Verrucomicrobiota bacterium]|nr:ankyrin repeat domain-containing protein [Verrucomicrobiota bacterium]